MAITFDNPELLWFLLAIPVLIIAHIYNVKYKKVSSLKFSNFEAMSRVITPMIIPYGTPQLFIRILVFTALVFAATGTNVWYAGMATDINFALAIDASSSMTANDFEPNRIEVAKEAAKTFIDELPITSKVGVASFSGTTFIDKKVTQNLGEAKNAIDSIEVRRIGGTDIGSAIITAVNMLPESEKSKVVVLLTDGRSTVGVSPVEAVEYARENAVIVHTIGMGTKEGGKFGGTQAVSTLDEKLLMGIANYTGGIYRSAEDIESLKEAYRRIASLSMQNISFELGPFLISIILLLFIMQWLLSFTRYSQLP